MTIKSLQGVLLGLILSSIGLNSHALDTYTIDQLENLINSKMKNSISTGDDLTLILESIQLTDSDAKHPRIIEVRTTARLTDNDTDTFSTVIPKAFVNGNFIGSGIGSDENLLVESLPLRNVDTLSLVLTLRPFEPEHEKTFLAASKLLQNTISQHGEQVVQAIKDLVPTSAEPNAQERTFKATFNIPENYIQFFSIKKVADKSYAMLEPGKIVNIPFEVDGQVLATDILSKLGNFFSESPITDKTKISGVVSIKAIKEPIKKVHQQIEEALITAVKKLRRGNYNDAREALDKAEEIAKLVYSNNVSSRQMDSVIFFIDLARLEADYHDKDYGFDVVAPKFESWVQDKLDHSVAEGYFQMRLKGLHKRLSSDPSENDRAALFFFPYSLENKILHAAKNYQKRLHKMINANSFPGKDRIVDTITMLVPTNSN